MRSVKFAGDNVVEKLLPVGLGDDFDLEAFFFEESFFLGDYDRSAIGELDESELELVFFNIKLFSPEGREASCNECSACLLYTSDAADE